MLTVPTINLAAAEQQPELLAPLDAACRDHGFFLLENHGMDAAINRMWQAAETFFSQPAADKRRILRDADNPLGYYDRELTKRRRDLKEVFDYMQPRADGSDRNQWPGDPAFHAAMVEFFSAASSVAERTLALVYRALLGAEVAPGLAGTADAAELASDITGLPPGDPRTSTVRLNHYPVTDPLAPEERAGIAAPGDVALGHHTDPGVLTLLLQDNTGGLQTHSRADGWIDVPPVNGTIVVNLGDAMQVWTNDHYRAAVHRVLPMQGKNRYSTPYFFNPGRDAVLEPLAGLPTGAPVYRSFTWKEYIKGRVDDNYADLGEDDIQIDRFRIAS